MWNSVSVSVMVICGWQGIKCSWGGNTGECHSPK